MDFLGGILFLFALPIIEIYWTALFVVFCLGCFVVIRKCQEEAVEAERGRRREECLR